MLVVWYSDAKTIALAEARKKDFNERKELNGPTGWITTEKGRFHFLRIGSTGWRDVVELQVNPNKGEYIPIEEVSSIKFHSEGAKFTATMKDGRTVTLNRTQFVNHYELDKTVDYGSHGLPLVMVDTEKGDLKQQIISNSEGLKLIEIDSEEIWKGIPEAELRRLEIYHVSANAENSAALRRFIKTYQNNDPEELIVMARKRLPIIEAKEAKLAALKRKEDELKRKEISERVAAFRKTVAVFRRSVNAGDDSHCGLVIERKPTLVKIQTMIGERWLKISQVYPVNMASCNFFNNTYQEPVGLPL